MDIIKYKRTDFIDDSTKIDFEVPNDLKWLIEKYTNCIDEENYQSALDWNFHLDTFIKNDYVANKISQREMNILCKKYHI